MCIHIYTSLVAQMVKSLLAIQETQVQSLGWKDPLEKGTTTQSSILAWRIPWTEEPCGLYIYTHTHQGQNGGRGIKKKKNNRSDDSKTLSIAPSTKLALIIKCYSIKCLLLSLLLVIKTGPWELKNPTMKHNSDFRSDLHLMGPIVPTV